MDKKTMTRFYIVILAIGLVLVANGLILAWTGPSANPPSGNISSPINIGNTEQVKSGRLGVAVSDADNSYGFTVGTNNAYGIKSDRWSWFGEGLQASGWALSNDYLREDGENVIRVTDEWLRLNQDRNFANGVYTPGLLRADGGLNVSDDEGFYRNAEDSIRTGDALRVDGDFTAGSDVRFTGGLLSANGGIVTPSVVVSNLLTVAGSNVCRQNGVNCPAASTNCASCDTRFINVGESGDSIADNTVDGSEIQNDSLTAADLAADSVRASELANNSVASANIIDSSIGPWDINTNNVFTMQGISDRDDSSYYLDPNNSSRFNGIRTNHFYINGIPSNQFCFFANNCPSGWVDRGRSGFVSDRAANCPFLVGAVYGSGPSVWCRARLCCN